MKYPCSGVILAGGENERFNGKNKAFIKVGGRCIIDRIYSIFNALFDEIILITNDPLLYLDWDLNIMPDIFSFRSSLTGIHAGLFFMTNPYAFFLACDIPFLKKEVAEKIINNIETGIDVIIPETSKGLEPLCAVYSKRCLKPVENNLINKELKIEKFFQKVKVKKVKEKFIREKDPDLATFFNINTPDDLVNAEKMV